MSAPLAAFCLFLFALGQTSAAPIALVDGLGRAVALPEAARRVVSLSPSCTEALFAIGAGDRIVGVTSYCNYPSEAASKPKVGGFAGKSLSIESIVALKPDLVVVEGQMHAQVVSMLENARVRCWAAEAKRLEDAYRIVDQLGVLVGAEDGARRVSARMRSRIEAVGARTAAAASRPSAFWVVWDDPLMTSGGATFINDAIFAAGGRNVFADSPDQYPSVSFESVLARNPDWIVSGTDHGAKLNAATLSRRQGWRSLGAVRGGRIALIDADSVNRAGPRLADAVEALARSFHPDLFE